jgi:hypothetical protein
MNKQTNKRKILDDSTESNEKRSPHTLQSKILNNYSNREFTAESRIITNDSPREKYQRRFNQDKTTFKFGQRKLMLSEIEFLTIASNDLHLLCCTKKAVLIYAGAAPGIHIASLMNLFPYIEYVLIDPAKFLIDKSKPITKFRIINGFFTDEMAEQLRKEYDEFEILFISDIRSADHRIMSKSQTELQVTSDMNDQMRWHRTLKSFKSMLKFRLPYVGDDKIENTKVPYLDGKIYLQMWQGKTSSETRLIVDRDAEIKLYDCVQYEDQLYRFNTVERVMCYKHDVEAPGIDHCFDCRSEVFILEEYLRSVNAIESLCKITNLVYKKPIDTVENFILLINKELNAFSKTGGIKLTIKGKTNMYCCIFTDIFYGANIDELFNPDKIVKSKFVKTNSSSEDDDFSNNNKTELFQSKSVSIHCLQNKTMQYDNDEFNENSRQLTDSFREKARPKHWNHEADRTTIYFKERGMRLIEIEFLTLVCKEIAEDKNLKCKKIVLIYAGASSSKNLHLLQEMFPFIKFLLYDPVKIETESSTMIEIRREYFTEETSLELVDKYSSYIRIFMSNIRKADKANYIGNIRAEKEDMSLQMNCHKILKPFKSLLKFRIPYPDIKAKTQADIDFFDGKLYFPLWSLSSSIDSFMIVNTNAKIKTYAYHKYRNQMYRFNTVERVKCYNHDVVARGIDHCYDCRAEVYIFELYMKSYKEIFIQNFKYGKENKNLPHLEKNLKTMIEDFNKNLKADIKLCHIFYNQDKYTYYFTNSGYGKKIDDILNKNTNNASRY